MLSTTSNVKFENVSILNYAQCVYTQHTLLLNFENVSFLIYAQCVYTQHTLLFQNLLYTHLCVYAHPICTHFLPILVLIYMFIIILLFIIIYLLLYYILLLLFLKSYIKPILKYPYHEFIGITRGVISFMDFITGYNMLWRALIND